MESVMWTLFTAFVIAIAGLAWGRWLGITWRELATIVLVGMWTGMALIILIVL